VDAVARRVEAVYAEAVSRARVSAGHGRRLAPRRSGASSRGGDLELPQQRSESSATWSTSVPPNPRCASHAHLVGAITIAEQCQHGISDARTSRPSTTSPVTPWRTASRTPPVSPRRSDGRQRQLAGTPLPALDVEAHEAGSARHREQVAHAEAAGRSAQGTAPVNTTRWSTPCRRASRRGAGRQARADHQEPDRRCSLATRGSARITWSCPLRATRRETQVMTGPGPSASVRGWPRSHAA